MEKYIIWVLVFLGWVYIQGAAQSGAGAPPKIYGSLYQLPLKEKAYEPDYTLPQLYIHDRWSMGTFQTLAGNQYGAYPMRYDLLGQNLEILLSGGITKVLEFSLLKSFSWVFPNTREWESYVATTTYELQPDFAPGVMQVLFQDRCQLLAYQGVEMIPAFYIPQLDAGKREDTYLREVSYFLATQEGQTHVIPRKPQRAYRVFAPFEKEIKRFVKNEFLSFRRKTDLIRIVTRYNQLLAN